MTETEKQFYYDGIRVISLYTDIPDEINKNKTLNGYVYRPILVKEGYYIESGYYLSEIFENIFPNSWNNFLGGFVAINYLKLEDELKDKLGKLYQRL